MRLFKFLVCLLLINILTTSNYIFGDELNKTNSVAYLNMEPEKCNVTTYLDNGYLEFHTKGYYNLIDNNTACGSKIEINESKPGLLKKGEKIYLTLDNLILNDVDLKTTVGDLELDASIIGNNILAISVEKESTSDSYTSIEISANFDKKLIEKKIDENFEYREKLYISTEKNLKDNIFSEYSEDILISDRIFMLEKYNPYSLPKIQKNLNVGTDDIIFTTEGGTGTALGNYIYPKSIVVTEKNAGALKKENEFYLYVKDMLFMQPLMIKTEGDIGVNYKIINDGMICFKVNKESTHASAITISNIILKRENNKNYEMRKTYYLPLMYSTNEEKANAKTINECFCAIRQENEEQETQNGNGPIVIERENLITESEMTGRFNRRLSSGNIISINSVGSSIPFRADICQPKEIVISEETAGALKENHSIYFKVGSLRFNDLFTMSTEGDIEANCFVDGNGIMKISVISESSVPSKIKIENIAVEMGEAIIEKPDISYRDYTYNYPLMIINDKYDDNLFNSSNGNIIINNKFVVQQERTMEIEYPIFAFERIVVNSNSISINSKKYNLENECYLKDNRIMVPLREFTNLVFNLDSNYFTYDENEKYIEMLWGLRKIKIYTEGNYMLINNIKKELFTNVDLKNGTAYISFRDWVNIFSRETGYEFFWDSDKQTVFFRTK